MGTVQLFKGCAWRAPGVSIERFSCQEICRVPQRNTNKCAVSGCLSPWRFCVACVAEGVRDQGLVDIKNPDRVKDGLCDSHAKSGKGPEKKSDKTDFGSARRVVDPVLVRPRSLKAGLVLPTQEPVALQAPTPLPAPVAPAPTPAVAAKPAVIPRVSEGVEEADIEERKERFAAILARARKAIAEGVLVTVPLMQVHPMQGQPRTYFDPGSITLLSESLKTVGQVQPGYLRKHPNGKEEEYEILDGERRWRALGEADLPTFRAILIEIDDEAAPFIIAAIANFNRAGHTYTEVSDAINRMHSHLGLAMVDIAQCLGISMVWAYQMHGLQNLHPSVRDMLSPHAEQKLPVTAAHKISKLPRDKQLPLARKVITGEIRLSALRQEVLDTADREGAYVRQRTNAPSEDWRIAVKKAESMEGQARDLVARLRGMEASLPMTLLGKKDVAVLTEAVLQKAIESLQKAKEIITKARTT